MKAKVDAGDLWVDGPTPVTKYRFARTSCPLPTAQGSTLKFSTPSADCMKYATPLSYIVSMTGIDAGSPGGDSSEGGASGPTLKAQQRGYVTAVKSLGGGQYVVNANPTWGDVVLGE